MTRRPVIFPLALVVLFAAGFGCGAPAVRVETAPGLVELEGPAPYEYRALAPEGVVFAARSVDTHTRGDLVFWTRATTLRVKDLGGYALLGASDVRSRDGAPGRELRFGHDEGGKPYLYTVRLFVARGRLVLVESGGPRAEVERYAPSLDWMMASVRVR
jgi:hypothetical protein